MGERFSSGRIVLSKSGVARLAVIAKRFCFCSSIPALMAGMKSPVLIFSKGGMSYLVLYGFRNGLSAFCAIVVVVGATSRLSAAAHVRNVFFILWKLYIFWISSF